MTQEIDGTFVAFVPGIGIRAGVDECLTDFQAAHVGGAMQGGVAVFGANVGIGIVGEQFFDDLGAPVLGSDDDGCAFFFEMILVRRHVEISPGGDEDASFLGMIIDECGIENRGEEIIGLLLVADDGFVWRFDIEDELVAEVAARILHL